MPTRRINGSPASIGDRSADAAGSGARRPAAARIGIFDVFAIYRPSTNEAAPRQFQKKRPVRWPNREPLQGRPKG
jgi:hypothetical protein